MYFIEGCIALADRLGVTPDDVYILLLFGLIFWYEFLGFLLAVVYRLVRQFFRWLRSRRKKES